jgi:hypothetical protein
MNEIRREYVEKTGHKPVNTTNLSSLDQSEMSDEMKILVDGMSYMYLSQDVVEIITAHLMNVFYTTDSSFVKLGGTLLCKTLTDDSNIGAGSMTLVREHFLANGKGLSKTREIKRLFAILSAKGLTNKLVTIVNKAAGKGSCNVYVLRSHRIRAALGRKVDAESIEIDTLQAMKLAGFSDTEIETEKEHFLK